MPTQCQTQLLVDLDQSLEGVVIWCWAVAVDESLHAPLCCLTALGKFLDEVATDDFFLRGALYQLKKDLRGISRFLDSRGKFVRWGKLISLEDALVGLLLRRSHRGSIRVVRGYAEVGRRIQPGSMTFFGSPHVHERYEIVIVGFVRFQRIKCLPKYLLHAPISSVSKQVLGRTDKLGVHVSCELRSWVVGQDTYKHNGVVLDMRPASIVFGEELSNLIGGSCGCLGRRLGSFDDDWEVQDFFTLLQNISCDLPLTKSAGRTLLFIEPDSQNSRWARRQHVWPHDFESQGHTTAFPPAASGESGAALLKSLLPSEPKQPF